MKLSGARVAGHRRVAWHRRVRLHAPSPTRARGSRSSRAARSRSRSSRRSSAATRTRPISPIPPRSSDCSIAIEADGPVDVVVNNAGVELAARFVDTDAAADRSAVPDQPARAGGAVPAGARRACCRAGGATSSTSRRSPASPRCRASTPYSASKAGLSQLTAGLRAETKGAGIGTTLVELGPVVTGMLERVHEYGPTARSFGRGARLGVLVDLDPTAVGAAIVDAVRRDRRHVRMPKRAAAADADRRGPAPAHRAHAHRCRPPRAI